MRFSLKTSKRTYSPQYHSICMASSPDVRYDRELYFYQPLIVPNLVLVIERTVVRIAFVQVRVHIHREP
jgi:hypothetical protein